MGLRDDITAMSKEEVVARFRELETELKTFEEASKDLETLLEDEVSRLEGENQQLKEKIQAISIENRNRNNALTAELARLQEQISIKETALELQRSTLRTLEMDKTGMEDGERTLVDKIEALKGKYNDLVEQVVLLEQDLETEKNQNLQKDLWIFNYQTEILQLKAQLKEKKLVVLKSNPPFHTKDPPPPSSSSGTHRVPERQRILLLKNSKLESSNNLKKMLNFFSFGKKKGSQFKASSTTQVNNDLAISEPYSPNEEVAHKGILEEKETGT
ncbi:uncharacterized protein KQ657_000673 [Scheffersomyces spartinae]|uniref:Uncharacterized protein n=1 Tax=Scheffersomyces spartinae TaxID=45513 RepID=A0A9P8AHQ1_9ASCO|nr:uncharacterized protein KQ657_000673 [Scheffersomyces spartinae]KAG7193602.1 hypothetical protein KQ657_000673 [Scheffersomyces spartinae]